MSVEGARVSRLARYPVKGCAAEPLEDAEVRPTGLAGDRALAVVVGDRVATQREIPELALVRPVLDDAAGLVTLTFRRPGAAPTDSTQGPVRREGRTIAARLFGEAVAVVDQDPELSAWVSGVLGRPARLVAAPHGRPGLFDEGTVSLHSEASLLQLNERLGGRGHPALPAERFRANVVIAGVRPHEEDQVKRFDLGSVTLRLDLTNTRCAVTTVDQSSGRRAGPEPLRTLAGYRRAGSGGVLFGVYTSVERPGTLRVGDPVGLHRS
jgi:uncharacterized protein YcbX